MRFPTLAAIKIYKITDSEIPGAKKALVFFLELFLIKDLDSNDAVLGDTT
jgi:hypothetical protein